MPVSRVNKLRSRPADKVFQRVGEQGGDSVSDQRLDGGYFDSRFFKGPCADEEQKAYGCQPPSLADPISRIAGERHPRNGELVPG